jgi:hypothetical protein
MEEGADPNRDSRQAGYGISDDDHLPPELQCHAKLLITLSGCAAGEFTPLGGWSPQMPTTAREAKKRPSSAPGCSHQNQNPSQKTTAPRPSPPAAAALGALAPANSGDRADPIKAAEFPGPAIQKPSQGRAWGPFKASCVRTSEAYELKKNH